MKTNKCGLCYQLVFYFNLKCVAQMFLILYMLFQENIFKCAICREDTLENTLIYKNDSTYQNLLQHLLIVQKRSLFHGCYDDLVLPEDPSTQQLRYHSSCHKRIIRTKDYVPSKKDKVTNAENSNLQNAEQENVNKNEDLSDGDKEANNESDDSNYIPDDEDDEDYIPETDFPDPHPDYLPDLANPRECR